MLFEPPTLVLCYRGLSSWRMDTSAWLPALEALTGWKYPAVPGFEIIAGTRAADSPAVLSAQLRVPAPRPGFLGLLSPRRSPGSARKGVDLWCSPHRRPRLHTAPTDPGPTLVPYQRGRVAPALQLLSDLISMNQGQDRGELLSPQPGSWTLIGSRLQPVNPVPVGSPATAASVPPAGSSRACGVSVL